MGDCSRLMPQINSDFTLFVSEQIYDMEWVLSPVPGVWRKRVYMDGSAENCKVTSVVRYDAGAHFPEHSHPNGEEILVLEGVFSDQDGNFGPGWHLLNPNGSHHKSYSENGCHILVKLQQYLGERVLQQDTARLEWKTCETKGIWFKCLNFDAKKEILTQLIRIDNHTKVTTPCYSRGMELYVLRGSFEDGFGTHKTGNWLRYPPNVANAISTISGCVLYAQFSGLRRTI